MKIFITTLASVMILGSQAFAYYNSGTAAGFNTMGSMGTLNAGGYYQTASSAYLVGSQNGKQGVYIWAPAGNTFVPGKLLNPVKPGTPANANRPPLYVVTGGYGYTDTYNYNNYVSGCYSCH